MIRVTPDKAYEECCNESTLYVDYENIADILNAESPIYIDDGLICIRVKEKGIHFKLFFDLCRFCVPLAFLQILKQF